MDVASYKSGNELVLNCILSAGTARVFVRMVESWRVEATWSPGERAWSSQCPTTTDDLQLVPVLPEIERTVATSLLRGVSHYGVHSGQSALRRNLWVFTT